MSVRSLLVKAYLQWLVQGANFHRTGQAQVTGLTLAAGTYWIGFYNSQGMTIPAFLGGNGSLIQVDPPHSTTLYANLGGNAGYELLGSTNTPEPATWITTLIGVVALGARRKSLRWKRPSYRTV